MEQELIKGLPEYLRTDTFVYISAQRSYQQLSTYVAGKYRAAKDVMALASRASPERSSRNGQTSTKPRGVSANQLYSPWEEKDNAPHYTVAVLPSGTPGFRSAGAAPYPRQEAPLGPPLCYMCWTRGQRVPDCKILTDKQRDLVKAARRTFLRQRNAGAGVASDRTSVVALVWTTCWAARSQRRLKGGTPCPWQPRPKGAEGREMPKGGWRCHPLQSPLSASTPRSIPVTSRSPPRE